MATLPSIEAILLEIRQTWAALPIRPRSRTSSSPAKGASKSTSTMSAGSRARARASRKCGRRAGGLHVI